MKTLSKLALAAVMLTAALSAQAEWVRGYFRSNGTYVAPYYRTPANGIPYDNLSYRYPAPTYASYAYVPSPPVPSYGYDGGFSDYSTPVSIEGSSMRIGDTTFHDYYSSEGAYLSGTTITIGDTTFTSLEIW